MDRFPPLTHKLFLLYSKVKTYYKSQWDHGNGHACHMYVEASVKMKLLVSREQPEPIQVTWILNMLI